MDETTQQEQAHEDHEHHEHQVTVTVDTKEKRVRSGDWLVSEFKKEVGVDADRVLDEVIGGEFKPLDDKATIDIEGGEVFVSHVRQGGSS
jgi:hypothetical protein